MNTDSTLLSAVALPEEHKRVRRELALGDDRWTTSRASGTGLVIHGLAGGDTPPDYLHDRPLTPANQGAFFDLVDREGLVVCFGVRTEHPGYRLVRGRSSKGKLSQGEYFHHDGCSGPVRPRIVEIRFPHQAVARHVATAVAPFPGTVIAMLHALPAELAALTTWDHWRDWVATEWSELGLGAYAVRRVSVSGVWHAVTGPPSKPWSLYDLTTKRSSNILTDPTLRDAAVDLGSMRKVA